MRCLLHCVAAAADAAQAPYLRFSDKQLRRLFYRLRESLERGGQVQRVRAFCRQTARFEPCLLLSAAAAPPSSAAAAAAAPSAAPAVQLQEYRGQTGGSSLMCVFTPQLLTQTSLRVVSLLHALFVVLFDSL